MFGTRRVALFAAAAVAGGMLSLSVPVANAQALRFGLANPALANAGAVETVAWRGGGGPRVGAVRVGGPRVGMRPGFVGRPGYVGRPGFVGRPGYVGRPGFVGRPGVVGRPGYVGRPVYAGRPGWGPGRPGWGPGRPGWGPGGPGWGHPGWRPPPGAWGPGPWRPGWGWYRPGWGWGYYNNTGAWIALGVASGLALGAVAAANAEPVYTNDAVAYCMSRFRSYNPNTGTYTGYDGLQHPCP